MKIYANGTEIEVMANTSFNEDYLCLTDLARRKTHMNQKMLSKIGFDYAPLLNFWDYGNNCIIQILKGSNSTPLKMKPVPMLSHLHHNAGLRKPVLLVLFLSLEEEEAPLHIKTSLLNLHLGFLQNLSSM